MIPVPDTFADSRNTGERQFPDDREIWHVTRRRDWVLVRLENGERLTAAQVARESGWNEQTARSVMRALEKDGCAVVYRPKANIAIYEAAP